MRRLCDGYATVMRLLYDCYATIMQLLCDGYATVMRRLCDWYILPHRRGHSPAPPRVASRRPRSAAGAGVGEARLGGAWRGARGGALWRGAARPDSDGSYECT